jgi:ABC-type nitrate/sulfonate/bicarbonate transport system substrate-binding protein
MSVHGLFRAIVLLVGGSLSAPVLAQSPVLTPVRIEVPSKTNLQFFALWVAVGSGAFQAEGLTPQILVAPSPRSTGEMLFKGDAEVALLPPPMFLGMIAEQKPLRLFASLLSNEPINLVVRKDVAEARGISTQASLRERLTALRGARIGLAPEVSPRLKALYASAGMDAEKDAQLVVVPGPDQVQALAGRKVDALFAHTPYLETAIVQYGATLLVGTSKGEIAVLRDGQVHALATTKDVARTKPELIAAVARAIARAERLIHSDQKATVDALVASGATKPDRRLTEAIAAIYAPAVPDTPQLSLDGIVRDAKLYPAHPRAPDFTRVKASDYVSAEFAR